MTSKRARTEPPPVPMAAAAAEQALFDFSTQVGGQTSADTRCFVLGFALDALQAHPGIDEGLARWLADTTARQRTMLVRKAIAAKGRLSAVVAKPEGPAGQPQEKSTMAIVVGRCLHKKQGLTDRAEELRSRANRPFRSKLAAADPAALERAVRSAVNDGIKAATRMSALGRRDLVAAVAPHLMDAVSVSVGGGGATDFPVAIVFVSGSPNCTASTGGRGETVLVGAAMPNAITGNPKAGAFEGIAADVTNQGAHSALETMLEEEVDPGRRIAAVAAGTNMMLEAIAALRKVEYEIEAKIATQFPSTEDEGSAGDDMQLKHYTWHTASTKDGGYTKVGCKGRLRVHSDAPGSRRDGSALDRIKGEVVSAATAAHDAGATPGTVLVLSLTYHGEGNPFGKAAGWAVGDRGEEGDDRRPGVILTADSIAQMLVELAALPVVAGDDSAPLRVVFAGCKGERIAATVKTIRQTTGGAQNLQLCAFAGDHPGGVVAASALQLLIANEFDVGRLALAYPHMAGVGESTTGCYVVELL